MEEICPPLAAEGTDLAVRELHLREEKTRPSKERQRALRKGSVASKPARAIIRVIALKKGSVASKPARVIIR
eukprot:scaffold28410_cov17-Tisochrysis_lutea.AAC.1